MRADVLEKIEAKAIELWGDKHGPKHWRHCYNTEKNREGLITPKKTKPHKILSYKITHKLREVNLDLLYKLFDMVKEELDNNIDDHIGEPTEPFLINNIKYFDYEHWLLDRDDILKDYVPQVRNNPQWAVVDGQPHNKNRMDILELGAGNGWLSFLLRNVYGHNVIATDCSSLALKRGEPESDFFSRVEQSISDGPRPLNTANNSGHNWICNAICGGVLKIPLRYLRIVRQKRTRSLGTKFDLIIATHYTAYYNFTDEDWVFFFKDLTENHLKSGGTIVLQPITGKNPEWWTSKSENANNWLKLGEKIDCVVQSEYSTGGNKNGILIVKRN